MYTGTNKDFYLPIKPNQQSYICLVGELSTGYFKWSDLETYAVGKGAWVSFSGAVGIKDMTTQERM